MCPDDKTFASDRSPEEAKAAAEPVTDDRQAEFIDNLVGFAQRRQAESWSGTLESFLETVVRANPTLAARTAQQYVWDMLQWQSREDERGVPRCTR